MSTSSLLDVVIRQRSELQPIATDVEPELQTLKSVRAVVFDVYGTLVISGSGDVGTANGADRGSMIATAIEAAGAQIDSKSMPTIAQLQQQIRIANDVRRNEVCPTPEVDIVDVWRATLKQHAARQPQSQLANLSTQSVVRLAAEYEALANPTWPMPGASELIVRLRDVDLPLGIVSNAQVFTVPLVNDLLEEQTTNGAAKTTNGSAIGAVKGPSGFDLNLCIFSNRFRQAKPGPRLFDALRAGLSRRGIAAHEALYVGNDMLNDVWAASQAGLRTAWFAGDRRSCRPRRDDPRCRSLRPDLVLTKLMQLPDCLQI